MTLAKALAGGVACGGLVARPEFAEKLRPGTHAATFGGNPIACRAALATIETIEADGLLARGAGDRRGVPATLRGAARPLPADPRRARQAAAMIGVELSIDGAPIVNACLERRLLINCTHGTVLRLLPALTLTDAELDEGCGILEEVSGSAVGGRNRSPSQDDSPVTDCVRLD